MYVLSRIILIAFIVFCAALTGCQYHQKSGDELPMQTTFGQSHRQQIALQKLDQEPAPATPVTGLDGKRAAEVMKAYQTPDAQDTSVAQALESLMKVGK